MSTFSALSKTLAAVSVALAGGALIIYSGSYPIGADVPHNQVTYWLLETLREQSVQRAARDISLPADLNSPRRLLAGGADYNQMCAQCHLKPGSQKTDMSLGLYPAPPSLVTSVSPAYVPSGQTEADYAMRRQFWIIKHGIKASGMPAWGPTHSDERIWNMVAFLQQLPLLSPEQYQILTAWDPAQESESHH